MSIPERVLPQGPGCLSWICPRICGSNPQFISEQCKHSYFTFHSRTLLSENVQMSIDFTLAWTGKDSTRKPLGLGAIISPTDCLANINQHSVWQHVCRSVCTASPVPSANVRYKISDCMATGRVLPAVMSYRMTPSAFILAYKDVEIACQICTAHFRADEPMLVQSTR